MTAIPSIAAVTGAARAAEADALAEPFDLLDVDAAALDLDAIAIEPGDIGIDSGFGIDPELLPPDDDAPPAGRPTHLRVAPRVSPEVVRRRRRARLLVLGVAVISAASMFTLVAFRVFAVQSSFELNHLNGTLAHEQQEYGILRGRVAALSSPAAVQQAAGKLGMVPAPNVTLLHAPSAASFASSPLPAPPQTQYTALAPPGP